MPAPPKLVVGTAGHIDHGKSRLVHLLTGTDPDRLPEEKARGMTIDLGFAHTQVDGCDIWFVDVPGHERFIRNMVAGATGIDAALLVVAADDSVMPQTREHAEVLALLGIQRCVVVISKMDLVDDEWAEHVEEEIGELLTSFGIEPLETVRTSAESGRGIDELRVILANLAHERGESGPAYRWFRLPIDRAFSIAGRGTVVTGSVAHGSVAAEDELVLWPAGRTVRVRDLQSHHEGRAAAVGRMRLALNLRGVSVDEAHRGCELATPGYLEPTRLMDVRIASLRMPGKVRRQRIRLRLHMATSEVLAELRLLAEPRAERVADEFGQLRLAQPIAASWGQRFILRDESGSRTLGGGCVLRPEARSWTAKRPADPEALARLHNGAAKERLEETIRAAQWNLCDDARLATRAGLADAGAAESVIGKLAGGGTVHRVEAGSVRAHFHRDLLESLAQSVGQRLEGFQTANPRAPGVAQSEWPAWMPRACPERLRPVVADWLIQHSHVSVENGFVVPRGERTQMAAEDQALLQTILRQYEQAAFQPPAVEALTCRTPRNAKRVQELLSLAAAKGQLVRIGDGLWLHGDRWREAAQTVTQEIRERGELTVSEIRTLLHSSRKFVVPIIEQLDAAGITRRNGDRRGLGAKPSDVN